MSLNPIKSLLPDSAAAGHPAAAAPNLRSTAFDLLRHAAAGQREQAQAVLEQLFSLRGRFPSYPLLQDIVAGKQPCRQSGALFVLGEQPLTAVMQRNFDDAIAQCQAFLGLPVPCILLQCKAESRDLHLTIESFPGLALLRLSTLSPGFPDDLRQVQFHEIAHCFVTCGVRLLDEGLAHLFASRFAGASLPAANLDLLPSMRALLSRSSDSMFGESVDSNVDVYRSACRVGADLLESIFALGGAERITRLFADVARASSEAHIVHLVEQASGQSFPAPITSGAPNAAQAELIAQARAAMFTAWINKNPADLDHSIQQLEAEAVFSEPALLDSLIGAQLNRALLQVNFATKPSREQEAHLDMLLKAAECLPPGRLWLWRGTRAILAILLARPNIIKVASAGQQAINAFNKAVQLIPNDPDLLVQHASLLMNAPAEYGGDRDLGVSKLRQAMQDPVYREHARHILIEYGVEQADPAEEAVEQTAEVAPPVVDAPPLIEVAGLELKFSPAFTLQPGPFTLKRGEKIALVGRNGSGKSMLMETLLGLRQPDRGTIQLHLSDASQQHSVDRRQQIGGLLQGADFPAKIKVREIMALHQAIYTRTEAAVTRALGLEELAERFWQQLSRGQKQRVMLWLALSHVPQLAFLDEPSLGLDEWFLRALRELLAKLPISLLIISHIPSDLLGMDRILCLDGGKIVAEGSLAELMTRRVGSYKGQVRQALSPESELALQALPDLVQPPRQRDGVWEMYGSQGFDKTFRHFIDQHRVTSFSLETASVEDFLADVAHDDMPMIEPR
ncbi:ATP-binding cassette domain-containing protein [Paraherbaspirillum soli]|uniref:ATP-binding cassette domain-containing protein n=1 Tax=Paraherbaspirillum soli TaxID=631222 RepID=A0ABW0MCI5_9BURK